MKPIESGFSLIELMVVVAIIGILAAIAIPAYRAGTENAAAPSMTVVGRVEVEAAGGLRTQLTSGGYGTLFVFKADCSGACAGGTITAWQCSAAAGTTIPAKFLPPECR